MTSAICSMASMPIRRIESRNGLPDRWQDFREAGADGTGRLHRGPGFVNTQDERRAMLSHRASDCSLPAFVSASGEPGAIASVSTVTPSRRRPEHHPAPEAASKDVVHRHAHGRRDGSPAGARGVSGEAGHPNRVLAIGTFAGLSQDPVLSIDSSSPWISRSLTMTAYQLRRPEVRGPYWARSLAGGNPGNRHRSRSPAPYAEDPRRTGWSGYNRSISPPASFPAGSRRAVRRLRRSRSSSSGSSTGPCRVPLDRSLGGPFRDLNPILLLSEKRQGDVGKHSSGSIRPAGRSRGGPCRLRAGSPCPSGAPSLRPAGCRESRRRTGYSPGSAFATIDWISLVVPPSPRT